MHQVAGVAVVLVLIDKSVTTAEDTAIDTVDVIIEGDIVDEDICGVGWAASYIFTLIQFLWFLKIQIYLHNLSNSGF